MSRQEMRKLMEAVSTDPLKKHGVTLDDYTWVEDGWLNVSMHYETDWDSIQEVDAILSAADPNQKIYQDYTAMGDDVPNTLAFKISALDQIDAILKQHGESLEEVLWMAGPGTYSDEGEAAWAAEQGYGEDDDDWDDEDEDDAF
jgi:hypothetical protein